MGSKCVLSNFGALVGKNQEEFSGRQCSGDFLLEKYFLGKSFSGNDFFWKKFSWENFSGCVKSAPRAVLRKRAHWASNGAKMGSKYFLSHVGALVGKNQEIGVIQITHMPCSAWE